jgi:ubiquinol-cytochrome c reductase cytochrome b subunit
VGDQGGLKGPDFSHLASRLSPDEMTVRIVNGGANMPAYGGLLKKEELNALLAFLSTRK